MPASNKLQDLEQHVSSLFTEH